MDDALARSSLTGKPLALVGGRHPREGVHHGLKGIERERRAL